MTQNHIPLTHYDRLSPDEMRRKSRQFYSELAKRRTVRHYSSEPIDQEVIDNCIRAAGTAPSGANQQPWHFVSIKDPSLKKQIRIAAEAEEEKFYNGRAGDVWIETLAHLGTNAKKPFLDDAPLLIAIFEQKFIIDENGKQIKHYYSKESTGIATGVLITALHDAGLATLTHTPSPMNFLKDLLKRPDGERPFLLLVVGYPSEKTLVPKITKKSLEQIQTVL